MTLVCAPGGYGKTTLALEALQKIGLPSAWYRLDELDRDPVVFLASITEAIAARVPAFGRLTRERLRSASQSQVSSIQLAAVLINDLAENLEDSLHLVIDDYHEAIDSPGLNATLEYLLTAAPDHLRFVILSRYEPAFAISKMRLAGEVTRLGVEQLRLTGREARLLVKDRGGVVLDEPSSERLVQLTQGWPASIALAAMALEWVEFTSIETAVSDPRLKRDVYGYLTEQVYSREKADTQEFLMGTCCLEYVSPELANDVAGRQDGHAQLEHLTANQVFTARATGDNTCRYHPLLRDFLRQRFLEERGAAAYHALQVRSAEAMERVGDLPSAIAIYLAANEGEEALNVISRADFGTLEDIRSDTLQAWISRLPVALRAHPWAMVLNAHLLMRSGKYEESAGRADAALSRFEERTDVEGQYQALCVKECALFWKGDNEGAREASQRAIEVAQAPEERVHALISLAAACEGQCRWEEALASLDRAASEVEDSMQGEQSRIVGHRGNILLLLGRLGEADRQFRQLDLTTSEAPTSIVVGILNSHGHTLTGLGHYRGAEDKFERGMELAASHGHASFYAILASCRSQAKLALNLIDDALHLAEQATRPGPLSEDLYSLSYAYSHLGTIFRRTGDPERAAVAYETASAVAREGGSDHALINASINLSFTLLQQGDRSSRRELQMWHCEATRRGMLFLALKSQFFLAASARLAGQSLESEDQLADWAGRALSLGHVNFMSQELILLPDAAIRLLTIGRSSRLRGDIMRSLALNPSALPLFLRMLSEDGDLAASAVVAAPALVAEDAGRLLRRAARHRDARVRRSAGALMKATPRCVVDGALLGLTARETEVLRLVADGLDNDEIAKVLYIVPSTVKTHMNHIFVKLGTSSRVNAARAYLDAIARTPSLESSA